MSQVKPLTRRERIGNYRRQTNRRPVEKFSGTMLRFTPRQLRRIRKKTNRNGWL